jgi:hypothetical protein
VETVGGILLDKVDEVSISDNIFKSVLAEIDSDDMPLVEQRKSVKKREFGSIIPQPLAEYIGDDAKKTCLEEFGSWCAASPNKIKRQGDVSKVNLYSCRETCSRT